MGLTKNQELFQEALTKVWSNPELKRELVEKPQETIKKVTGQSLDLPEGKTLVVIDSGDDSKVYVKIPAPSAAMDDIELSDEELEKVAGGTILPTDTGVIDSCFSDCSGGGDGRPGGDDPFPLPYLDA